MNVDLELQQIKDVVQAYLQALIEHRYGDGYRLLSDADRQHVSQEQWLLELHTEAQDINQLLGLNAQEQKTGLLTELREVGTPVISQDGGHATVAVLIRIGDMDRCPRTMTW